MASSITRRVGIGLTLAVLCACGAGYLVVQTSSLLITSGSTVEHTHDVLESISRLQLAIGRTRTAARSYGIVGDSSQKRPYRDARAATLARIDSLRTLTADNPLMLARLDSLGVWLTSSLSEWDQLVAGPPGNPAAMSLSYRKYPPRLEAQRLLDSLFVRMDRSERALLHHRAEANLDYVHQTRRNVIGIVVFSIVVVALTFVLLVRYLNQRARLEQERTQLQNFLDSIVENLPLMVFVKDATHLRFLRFNKAGEDLLGCSRDSLIGRNDYDLFPRDQADFFTSKDRETLKGEKQVVIEEEPINTALQGTRRLRTHKMAVRGADGWPLYLLGISEDITDRLQAEKDLKEALQSLTERTGALEIANRDLEAFSYTVSHDLRAPVRAIEGFARILLEDHAASLDDEGRRLLEVVRGNGRRMGIMIDDLLRLARVSRTELRRDKIDMDSVFKQQLDELAQRDPGREVELQIEHVPPALGDIGLVQQVTANLLGNAWKFTRQRQGASIRVRGRRQGGQAEYSVIDNGAGFDMKYADKLFGVFQRLHRPEEFEGTGVGLAVVHKIVERHGGRIWAESEPGHGATFHFTLPTIEGAA